ncbi:hypothetical protein C2S53_004673 [Perilla frutescens var. hirtella]|uniref:Uncharacterized protein n=1 Tax=Perilla frutescens var. hirtella TaxID=608512 RepID=A0AAD4PCN4_PERFH|nr:hypothetical protein C2S53_004673 [Perilla frutescens var. hirtella]
MKELRQERELKRTLSESARCSSTPFELSLSLWPESHTKHEESPRVAPAQSNLARSSYHSPPEFNLESSDSDIDTSLRL